MGSKNVKWNINVVTELLKEKVELMGEQEWAALCNKIKLRRIHKKRPRD